MISFLHRFAKFCLFVHAIHYWVVVDEGHITNKSACSNNYIHESSKGEQMSVKSQTHMLSDGCTWCFIMSMVP